MTEKQAVEKVLGIARAQIGYHEGPNNYNKYAADLEAFPNLFWGGSKQNLAWCCVFVVWLFVKAFGYDDMLKMLCAPGAPNGLAGCSFAAGYYRSAGRWSTTPHAGDQIFFGTAGSETHTGIVESVSGNVVTTIEGNTSDGAYRRQYGNNSNIAGYGRPKWDVAANDPDAQEDPKPTTMYTLALPVIRSGDSGPFVKAVQILLIADGHYCGGKIINKREIPDGEFGPSTENAVKIFQMANRLDKDGIVGKLTMEKLLGRGGTDG